jgi:hypothetical protein
MKRRDIILFAFCAAIVIAVMVANSLRLSAQDQPGFIGNKVTPLVKVDLTGVTNKQVIANIYEVPAGHMVPFTFLMGMNSIWSYRASGPRK